MCCKDKPESILIILFYAQKRQYYATYNSYDADIAKAQSTVEMLYTTGKEHDRIIDENNGKEIPAKYCNRDAFDHMIKMLEKGETNSLRGAFDLYDEKQKKDYEENLRLEQERIKAETAAANAQANAARQLPAAVNTSNSDAELGSRVASAVVAGAVTAVAATAAKAVISGVFKI